MTAPPAGTIHIRSEPRPEWTDKAIAVLVVVTSYALFSAWKSPIPYLWIAIAAVLVSCSLAVVAKRQGVRALWVNIAVIGLTLGVIEGYFAMQGPTERRMSYSEEFFIADEVLGYKPAPARRIGHRSYAGDQLLYDVTYTLDDHGLRIASPSTSDHRGALPCVAFFGDSFTFGEGMSDEHTMPYQVWKRLAPRYQTVNFAFLGYGPHQMLAALELGRVEFEGHCRPSHIVYQAIPSHVSRAAGLEAWDQHGPRYRQGKNGLVRLDGHFDDVRPETALEWLRRAHRHLHLRIQGWLEASALYRTLLNTHRPVTSEDVALFAGIVDAAKQTASRIYPGATFQVLFWDYEDDAAVGTLILSELRAHGISVYPMSTILPGFPASRARYEISPYDRHPNEQAHARIADFLAQHMPPAPAMVSLRPVLQQ